MKPLVAILRRHEESIARSLAARLEQGDCRRLARTEPGRCAALLAALASACGAPGAETVDLHAWAERLHGEARPLGLVPADVLAVLRRLERAVRVQVIRTAGGRKQLLALLNQLSNGVDVLRQAYLACAEPPADARHQEIEEALAESVARKRAIIESSLDPIITVDHHGVITEFNRAAEVAFGRRRREVLGTKPSDVLFPTARQRQQDRIDRYLAAGEGSLLGRRTEIVAARADGRTFDAELAMTISQKHGQPLLTFFVRDISQRKKAEADEARHRAELERSNRELERFAYVASHDLQEPLRKIRVFGQRLAQEVSGTLSDAAEHDLSRIIDATLRMERLIEGLLNLARVTTQPRRLEVVDLSDVAREVLGDLQAPIEQSGAEIECQRLPRLETADPLQMRQLLQNLLSNAIKFRRQGQAPRVRLRGELFRPAPEEGGLPSPWCRITVEDNGIGFETEQAERIFGLFHRLHARDVFEGTGVGLAVCRKIAERHGGTISARAAPGQGAVFEVLLPVSQTEPAV